MFDIYHPSASFGLPPILIVISLAFALAAGPLHWLANRGWLPYPLVIIVYLMYRPMQAIYDASPSLIRAIYDGYLALWD